MKTFVKTHHKLTFVRSERIPGKTTSSIIISTYKEQSRICSIYSHSIQEIVKMYRLACRNIPRSFKPLKRTYATAASNVNVTPHLHTE